MGDAGAGLAEASDLVVVEVDAVGQPGAIAEPAGGLEVVQRSHPEQLLTVLRLVLGFCQVGVQAHVLLLGQASAVDHQLTADREGRAGRQRQGHHGALAALMVGVDQTGALVEDGRLVLHHRLGRQPALLAPHAHRAAGQGGAHAEPTRGLYLDVDGVLERAGEHVVMVGDGGTAAHQQLHHGQLTGQRQLGLVEVGPDVVKGGEPGKQLLVERRRVGPGQGLVEVVVGVDQARQQHVAGGIEGLLDAGSGRLAGGHGFDDPAVLNDDTTGRVRVAGGQWMLDPSDGGM